MNTLGNEIASARIQQGFTQKEIAEKVHISPQYLCDIENNRRTPADNILVWLAEALNINLNYAFYLVGKYPPTLRGLDISLIKLDKFFKELTGNNQPKYRITK